MEFHLEQIDNFTVLYTEKNNYRYYVLQMIISGVVDKDRISDTVHNITRSKWYNNLIKEFLNEYQYDAVIKINPKYLYEQKATTKNVVAFFNKNITNILLVHEDVLQTVLMHIDVSYCLKIMRLINNIKNNTNFNELINNQHNQIEQLTNELNKVKRERDLAWNQYEYIERIYDRALDWKCL